MPQGSWREREVGTLPWGSKGLHVIRGRIQWGRWGAKARRVPSHCKGYGGIRMKALNGLWGEQKRGPVEGGSGGQTLSMWLMGTQEGVLWGKGIGGGRGAVVSDSSAPVSHSRPASSSSTFVPSPPWCSLQPPPSCEWDTERENHRPDSPSLVEQRAGAGKTIGRWRCHSRKRQKREHGPALGAFIGWWGLSSLRREAVCPSAQV